jgi:hypothetical protein
MEEAGPGWGCALFIQCVGYLAITDLCTSETLIFNVRSDRVANSIHMIAAAMTC